MYLLYSLLLTFGFVLLLPRFILDAFRNGKYVTGLGQRLGRLPWINFENQRVIWLHCVSVGEARAAQALVHALRERLPGFSLVVSTTTVTGQQLAREIFGNRAAAVFYFPIDWGWTVRRALRAVRPTAVLVMETELWPRLFRECRRKKIPVALVNGRISDKSFGRYKTIRFFIRRVLNDLSLALMQSDQDASRIRHLGLDEKRVMVSGNLKFDSAHAEFDPPLTEELRLRFRIDGKRPLIVAASTHADEEAIALEAFAEVRSSHPAARLLVAPRHPERFKEVAALLTQSGLSWVSRSAPETSQDGDRDVVLLDTIGELKSVYPLAELVFVGGSIALRGGHNVLEPAAHGVCTITGPHMQNFAAITKALLDEKALIQLQGRANVAAELASVISQLLSDDAARRELGARAQSVCARNRGATEKTVELISQMLAAPMASGQTVPVSTLHATTAAK